MVNISEKDSSISFTVRVVPRASKTEFAGELEGAVKVRVASPPVDGAANAELIKLFAKTLGVRKGDVEIVAGQASKTKHIRINGATAEQLRIAIS
ncbi:MAG TPA: DUF167 domain-containing protein [Pyrinomonadaceae bacterium]|jgi:uncharacterized protein (TIGR00251 family)|nr:DUF167 domain-containing protein [Pyrinomonadaceae bacterium]